jgi:hypothetical protein
VAIPSFVPDLLFHIPEQDKFVETFGWQPGIWGGFCLVSAILFAIPAQSPFLPLALWITAGAAFAGFCLTGYEVRRRRNRTVLVIDSGKIAVYRHGALDLVLELAEVTVVRADLVTMVKIGVPLAIAALLFAAIGVIGLLRDEAAVIDNLIILSLGLACFGSLASAAWTRFRCAHLRVPLKGSRWMAEETVLIPVSRLPELFP